jgi:hypothetical protein
MEPDRAIEIVQALADGVDPYSGDRFPSGSPYQQADTVGALHLALEGLTKLRRSTARKTGPGRVWTEDEEKELLREFDDKIDVEEIAAKHDRTNGAIWARLEKLDTVSIAKTSSAQCPIPRPRITRASRVRPGRLCRPAAITTTSPFSRIRTARSILQGCPSPGLQAVRSLSRRNGLKPGAHPSRPRSAARIERRRSRQLKQAVCAVNPCAALCRRCWWLRSLVSAHPPQAAPGAGLAPGLPLPLRCRKRPVTDPARRRPPAFPSATFPSGRAPLRPSLPLASSLPTAVTEAAACLSVALPHIGAASAPAPVSPSAPSVATRSHGVPVKESAAFLSAAPPFRVKGAAKSSNAWKSDPKIFQRSENPSGFFPRFGS